MNDSGATDSAKISRGPWALIPVTCLLLLSFGAFVSREEFEDPYWPGLATIWLVAAASLLVAWWFWRPGVGESDDEETLDLSRPLVPFVLVIWISANAAIGFLAVYLAFNVTGIPSGVQEGLLYSSLTIGLVQFGAVAIQSKSLMESTIGRLAKSLGYVVGGCAIIAAIILSALFILFWLLPFGHVMY